jgi:hypothetical protein
MRAEDHSIILIKPNLKSARFHFLDGSEPAFKTSSHQQPRPLSGAHRRRPTRAEKRAIAVDPHHSLPLQWQLPTDPKLPSLPLNTGCIPPLLNHSKAGLKVGCFKRADIALYEG